MDSAAYEELAGRIDGIGQALLRVVSALEMRQLVDGSRISNEWRLARPLHLAQDAQLLASHEVLSQMAGALDAARLHRRAHTH